MTENLPPGLDPGLAPDEFWCTGMDRERPKAKLRIPGTATERFVRLVFMPSDGNLCWSWPGKPTVHGYHAVNWEGRRDYLHRIAYTLYIGEIPRGAEIHHRCNNRACVNPYHLEVLSKRDHRLLSRRSHCHRGHPLEAGNVYIRPDNNRRRCMACHALRERIRKAA